MMTKTLELPELTQNKIKADGLVVYCDGSALLDHDTIGWGGHGYLYVYDANGKDKHNDNICTCKGYIPAKATNILEKLKPVRVISFIENVGNRKGKDVCSNNIAELLAVITIFDQLEQFDIKEMTILSDSEYVVKGLTMWCKNWRKNNWVKNDGTPVSNVEYWKQLYDQYTRALAQGIQIDVKWVKGHAGIEGNVQADILAGISSCVCKTVDKNIDEFSVIPSKEYGKLDVNRHPFLSYRRLYFNSRREFNQEGFYYQADTGIPNGDFVLGKKHPASAFSVLKMDVPDKVLEDIKQKQYTSTNDNLIMMIKLDRVYHKTVYPYLEKYNAECLTQYKTNANLTFMDGEPVTVEMNPVRLTMKALDNFDFLESMLVENEKYFNKDTKEPVKGRNCMVYNITDVFYQTSPKKGIVLRPEISNGTKDVTVEVKEELDGVPITLPINIVLGLDIIPRNNLKRLESEDPAIFLVTWKDSSKTLRYCTCIKCKSGSGIWCNFYANKLFLTVANRESS